MKKADRNKKGMIFNIQKFSVNDGPGIRTVVFFKGCPLHCRWCSNPESQLFKMQVLHERKKCAHCLHCINICPVFAINLVKEDIRIDASLCNGCKKCTVECPQRALEMAGYEKTVQDVIDVVLQDKVFYEEGGGITLSGGEFLAQSDFAMELLLAAKEENLHTCCETTGFARRETFNEFIPFIDYFLFDIKHWNKEKHIEGTGVSNELPLNNLKTVFQAGKTVLPPSKSHAVRLIAAGLMSASPLKIISLPRCDDVAAALSCAEAMGAQLRDDVLFPPASFPEKSALNCRDSGCAMRFFTAIAAFAGGSHRICGSRTLMSRPTATGLSGCVMSRWRSSGRRTMRLPVR